MAINYEKTALRWYDNAKKLGIALPARSFFVGLIHQYNNDIDRELAKSVLSPLRGNPSKQIVEGKEGAYFKPIKLGLERLNKAINKDRNSIAYDFSPSVRNQIGINLRDSKIGDISAQNMARRLVKGYNYGRSGYASERIEKYVHDYLWVLEKYFPSPYAKYASDIIKGWSASKVFAFISSNPHFDYDGLYLIDDESEWIDFFEIVENYE